MAGFMKVSFIVKQNEPCEDGTNAHLLARACLRARMSSCRGVHEGRCVSVLQFTTEMVGVYYLIYKSGYTLCQ